MYGIICTIYFLWGVFMADNKLSKKDNILQAVKFALFSASAGIIQVVTFTLLNEFMPEIKSNIAFVDWFFRTEYGAYYLFALILSILWNFTVNRKFTFKSATNIPIAMLKVFGFYCVFTPVSTILGEIATSKIPWSFGEYIVLGVTMLCNMVLEFLYCRFFVYRNSINTNNSAKNK